VTRVAIKNAKACQNRLRKLLSGAPRARAEPPEERDSSTILIESILEADASPKDAARAREALLEKFLDLNELRVATPREVADCWPKDFPGASEKAESLRRALNTIFDHTYTMSLDHMQKFPRRELRKHLLSLGLSPFASARILACLFRMPAVPVDSTLLETLVMEGLVPAGASMEEVQEVLERLVPPRGAMAAHRFLRSYVERLAKPQAARRRKEAQAAARAARLAEQARAKAEAEARAKAEAQARAKALAEAKAAAEAKARSRKSVAAKIRRAGRKRTKKKG
jgi:endonuclease III